jgi:hypothetical protein
VGLFGFVGKALGKVAKAGLSVVTGGKSDVVLKLLKGRGQTSKHPVFDSNQSLPQDQALMAKLGISPSVKNTERYLESAQAGVSQYGSYKKPKKKGAKTKWSKRALEDALTQLQQPTGPWRESGTTRRPAPPRLGGYKAPPKLAPSKAKIKRAPNAQAQKMAALGAAFRAAGGKAGTGMDFFSWKAGK